MTPNAIATTAPGTQCIPLGHHYEWHTPDDWAGLRPSQAERYARELAEIDELAERRAPVDRSALSPVQRNDQHPLLCYWKLSQPECWEHLQLVQYHDRKDIRQDLTLDSWLHCCRMEERQQKRKMNSRVKWFPTECQKRVLTILGELRDHGTEAVESAQADADLRLQIRIRIEHQQELVRETMERLTEKPAETVSLFNFSR